jgi:hypothetical protein
MKTAHSLLLMSLSLLASAASAFPGSTDEARADAGERIAAANRAASLQPFEPRDPEVILVTDTGSARKAAGQANARMVHDRHLSEMLRAGAGVKPAPIPVTDTDSARAATGQKLHEDALLADYAEYLTMRAYAGIEPGGASKH